MPELINWKPAFLKELAISPNVSRAARAAGVKRRTAYFARESDPEFAADWDDVIAESVDGLEVSAFRRAELESDVLAIFLLKSHRRAVYGDPKQVQVSSAPGDEREHVDWIIGEPPPDRAGAVADGPPEAIPGE
jgi:hypothetical protein